MAQHLYDPLDPSWFDAGATRAERDRTFHICSDCRVCVKLCPSFRSLFEMIDDLGGSDHADELDRRAAQARRRRVLPVQALLRHLSVHARPAAGVAGRLPAAHAAFAHGPEHEAGDVSQSARLLARTDQQGKVATTFAPIVNATAKFGPARVAMEKVTGIARDRLLPTFDRVRFSKWFRGRDRDRAPAADRPTAARSRCSRRAWSSTRSPRSARPRSRCSSATASRASCPRARCAAACRGSTRATPTSSARPRSATSTRCCRRSRPGRSIVVPQPTCAYMLKEEYPAFLGTDAARKVAAATFDASEFLMNAHKTEKLDTNFDGPDLRVDRLALGVPLPRAADRAAQLAADAAHRRQGADGRAVQRDRRHVGSARRERGDGAAGRQAA